jgi:hypothetical protein
MAASGAKRSFARPIFHNASYANVVQLENAWSSEARTAPRPTRQDKRVSTEAGATLVGGHPLKG